LKNSQTKNDFYYPNNLLEAAPSWATDVYEQVIHKYSKNQDTKNIKVLGIGKFPISIWEVTFKCDCSLMVELDVIEDAICQCLIIQKQMSLGKIGEILGLLTKIVDDNIILTDPAEKQLLEQASLRLLDYKIIIQKNDGFSLTDKGKKFAQNGHRPVSKTEILKLRFFENDTDKVSVHSPLLSYGLNCQCKSIPFNSETKAGIQRQIDSRKELIEQINLYKDLDYFNAQIGGINPDWYDAEQNVMITRLYPVVLLRDVRPYQTTESFIVAFKTKSDSGDFNEPIQYILWEKIQNNHFQDSTFFLNEESQIYTKFKQDLESKPEKKQAPEKEPKIESQLIGTGLEWRLWLKNWITHIKKEAEAELWLVNLKDEAFKKEILNLVIAHANIRLYLTDAHPKQINKDIKLFSLKEIKLSSPLILAKYIDKANHQERNWSMKFDSSEARLEAWSQDDIDMKAKLLEQFEEK